MTRAELLRKTTSASWRLRRSFCEEQLQAWKFTLLQLRGYPISCAVHEQAIEVMTLMSSIGLLWTPTDVELEYLDIMWPIFTRLTSFADDTDRLHATNKWRAELGEIGEVKTLAEASAWKKSYVSSEILTDLVNGGATAADLIPIVKVISKPAKLPRGRPLEFNAVTVLALDHQLTHNFGPAALAEYFCRCGKERHGKRCQDSIRQRLEKLKPTLSELDIPLKKSITDVPIVPTSSQYVC